MANGLNLGSLLPTEYAAPSALGGGLNGFVCYPGALPSEDPCNIGNSPLPTCNPGALPLR